MEAQAQAPNVGKIMSGLYILAALVVLFVLYKVMTGIGLIKTGKKKREEIAKEENISDLRTAEFFNPNYGDTHVFGKLGLNAANLYAEKLHQAMRGLGTDEEMIYSTFGTLRNKGQISEIASQYFLKYKRDLRTDILNELNKKEVSILMDIINKLSLV